jgi:fucose permease
MFFLTQYLQAVLGYSALESGVRLMPVAGGLILGSGLSAKLVAGAGTKRVVAAGLALVAAGLALLSGADVESGYGLIAAVLGVLGLGMGLTMAPATESVMNAVSLDKASVGSAINDATRTMGGALGVAVLGSLVTSGYRAGMDGAGDVARDSLAGALAVAQRIGGPGGDSLAATAQQAFVDGMHTAVFVAAAVAALGSLLVLVALPGRDARTALVAEPVPA